MVHLKRATAIITILIVLTGTAAYASPQGEGGAAGGILGGVAGALLDHRNPWRGGVIGAGLGAITGAALSDISVRVSQQAAQNTQPVEYRSYPDRRFYPVVEAPPPYAIPNSPAVVLIPGTYVYAAPDARVPVLFYGGLWWRSYEGNWYRADNCNGPWLYVRRVPPALVELPPDYPRMLHGRPRVAYGEWRDRRDWERHEGRQEGYRGRWEDRERRYRDR